MIRTYAAAVILSGLQTLVAAIAIHAPSTTVAVLAIAASVAACAVLAAGSGDAGLAIANPAWTVVLVIRGRRAYAEVLPLWASQLVGALAAAGMAHALGSRLPDALPWSHGDRVVVAVVVFVLSALAAFVVVFGDAHLNETATALPVFGAGALLPLNLAGALNPAVVFGVTVAGLADWSTTSIAVLTGLFGAIAGAYAVDVFIPDETARLG